MDDARDSRKRIPYARHWIDDEDIQAVVDVLRSDWLTTGPFVKEFEDQFAKVVKARDAVAVCNGTAALHACMNAIGIGPGDEVIVPTLTFAATANCVVYQGGTPVFCDVVPDTLIMDPDDVSKKITPKTKAMITVDYAGHPSDYQRLRALADAHGIILVSDSCHALGASYEGQPLGHFTDMSAWSFHPAKHITTAEGGAVTVNLPGVSEKLRRFRSHGISTDLHERARIGSWFYEMVDLGFNYRLTDVQCALGISQLRKLGAWVSRRRQIATQYNEVFSRIPGLIAPTERPGVVHAYHLYVLRCNVKDEGETRLRFYRGLKNEGIDVNVHYVPVHLHPFYRREYGTERGSHPVAERAYSQMLSLPMFPMMSDDEVQRVIDAVLKVTADG